jgi:hypothetical protein
MDEATSALDDESQEAVLRLFDAELAGHRCCRLAIGPASSLSRVEGTAHWMFDRGLISLKDDLEILISRHVNDAEGVKSIFNRSGRALAPSSASGRIRISSLGTASTASSTDQHEGLCFHKMADVAKGQGAPASAERDRHADREPGECCHHEIDVSDHETRAATTGHGSASCSHAGKR